jgi:hypothetical protein
LHRPDRDIVRRQRISRYPLTSCKRQCIQLEPGVTGEMRFVNNLDLAAFPAAK